MNYGLWSDWEEQWKIAREKAQKSARSEDVKKYQGNGVDAVTNVIFGNLVTKFVSGQWSELKHMTAARDEFRKVFDKTSPKYKAWLEEK